MVLTVGDILVWASERLVGLVVWFSLRVREVPGSTPGQAHDSFGNLYIFFLNYNLFIYLLKNIHPHWPLRGILQVKTDIIFANFRSIPPRSLHYIITLTLTLNINTKHYQTLDIYFITPTVTGKKLTIKNNRQWKTWEIYRTKIRS